jgi:hypothetical protein
MYFDLIVWDDEDDPHGNYHHIVTTGQVSEEEVADVIARHKGPWERSRSSGNPLVCGTASTGRRIVVVFVVVPDPEDVLIYPISAFPVAD